MLPGFMSPTKSNAKRESISEYKALSRVPVGGFASQDILVDGLQAYTQERDNWCWAAVGAALLAIQEGEFGQSRCKIANMYAGRSSYQSISVPAELFQFRVNLTDNQNGLIASQNAQIQSQLQSIRLQECISDFEAGQRSASECLLILSTP